GNPPLKTAIVGGSVPAACQLAGAGAGFETKDLAGRTVLDALRDSGEKFLLQLRQYQPESEVKKRGAQLLVEAVAKRPSFAELSDAVSQVDISKVKELLARG